MQTHAAVEQLSAQGSMLIQCVGDADWILSWCPLLDGACRTALEEPRQLLPSSSESYRIASEQVPKFRGGHCIKALGLHGQQQQNLQLRRPSDLRLPEYGACRAAARALKAETTTTAAYVGPPTSFGVTLLVAAICIYVAMAGSVPILNRVKDWDDPRAPAGR